MRLHEVKQMPNGKYLFEVRMPLKVIQAKKWTNALHEYLSSRIEFIPKKVVGFETEKDSIKGVETADG